jgi:hypothetical protein
MCPLDVKRPSCRSPKFIVEAYRRPPSDGSGLRRGSDVSVRFTPTSPLARVDVHADGDALLGHLDQVDAGTDDPHWVGETDRDTDRAPASLIQSHAAWRGSHGAALGLVSWIGNHTNDILEAQVRHDAATIHP